MGRPSITGRYAVPAEILALKPSDIYCTVKAISAPSKSAGSKLHYYVYELIVSSNPDNPEKTKVTSGPCIGKIEGGTYCPNKTGIRRFKELKGEAVNDDYSDTAGKSGDNCLTDREKQSLAGAAVNMNLDLKDIDLQVKDYGEYAIVLASTGSVLEKLNKYFSTEDSKLIYALSVIYFVQEYTPSSYIKDVYDQSVLSCKWPNLGISENTVSKFLKLLGQHPAICEKYSQGLIDESSGLTAIDGHVILSCSRQNDLADYGNKYSKIGNKQLNILEAYDVISDVPLTSRAYEGGLLDKNSVQDLLQSFDFPKKTTFLIDAGFYSEEDLQLFREDEKRFVIPVPDSCSISRVFKKDLSFKNSFTYRKTDENGLVREDRILYAESTVSKLEDLYQEELKKEAEVKNQLLAASMETQTSGEKSKVKKYYARKIKRSAFGDDRVIMYRDEDMHDKMISEFREQLGKDESHTEEKLKELGPYFGIIILRTNRDSKTDTPAAVYEKYKKRWKLETHYNFVENIVRFYGLKTDDYCTMQGLSFLILTVGQIKAAFKKKQMASSSKFVTHLSTRECLVKAGRLKLSQHQNKKWHIAVSTSKTAELMKEMGVDMANDIKKLNAQLY